jgi:hypothetical protein
MDLHMPARETKRILPFTLTTEGLFAKASRIRLTEFQGTSNSPGKDL